MPTTGVGPLVGSASAIAPSRRPRRAPSGARRLEQGETAVDQRLGLGTRDQRTGIDGKSQPPEAPLAEDVREWLAGRSAGDEAAETLCFLLAHLRISSLQFAASDAEHVRERAFGVDGRRGDPCVLERDRGLGQCLSNGQTAAVSSARAALRRSAPR